jgi:hypothetical protein
MVRTGNSGLARERQPKLSQPAEGGALAVDVRVLWREDAEGA